MFVFEKGLLERDAYVSKHGKNDLFINHSLYAEKEIIKWKKTSHMEKGKEAHLLPVFISNLSAEYSWRLNWSL